MGSALHDELITLLSEKFDKMTPGQCLRIDDIDQGTSQGLIASLNEKAGGSGIFCLGTSNSNDGFTITAENAIERRNRKLEPLLLFVPVGHGHAASSLDNSFARESFASLLERASLGLELGLEKSEISKSIKAVKKLVKAKISADQWVEFLSTLMNSPTMRNFGRELWQVGLVPDLGSDPIERLEANNLAVNAISRPRRPTASVLDRIVSAGVREGEKRTELQLFFERQPDLTQSKTWSRRIVDEHAQRLTFEKWPLSESATSHIESISIVPFVKENGEVDPTSKLLKGSNDQPVLEVPADGSASLVVQWTTQPPKIDPDSLTNWNLEVVLPSDLRTDESAVIGTTRVQGKARKASVSVSITEDDLTDGNRFVVRITATDSDGARVAFESHDLIDVDSQEFEILVALNQPDQKPRTATSYSIPEAILSAAIDGVSDREEDQGVWDLDRRVFTLVLGGRKLIKIQISPLVVQLQREISDMGGTGIYFDVRTRAGTGVDTGNLHRVTFDLPTALKEKRGRLWAILKSRGVRDTFETVVWDDELEEAVESYLASYRRAIDSSVTELREQLIRLDSLSLTVDTSERRVNGVLMLPMHPTRLAWLKRHNKVFRSWASALDALSKPNRASSVDIDLARRVTPANLPFCALHANGLVASYFDELTYGTALYLDPSVQDAEADAAVICAALDIARSTTRVRDTAHSIVERIDAFNKSHPTTSGLKVLAINPGNGDLLARTARKLLSLSDDAEEISGQRLEFCAYSDYASYSHPLDSLVSVQSELRMGSLSFPGSHLNPPLSLSRRPMKDLSRDSAGAHLGIVQGMAQSTIKTSSSLPDRAPSFDGLLTPTVFNAVRNADSIVLLSSPALRTTPGSVDEITASHRAHQNAIGRLISGEQDEFPALSVEILPENLARIAMIHSRADWVLTIDRQVGTGLFDQHLRSPISDAYILDYAPDFIDGIGDRLTVTTTQKIEVENLLSKALADLELTNLGRDAGDLLRSLAWVSGRLALRLLGDTSLAQEAASLAILMMHLEDKNELDGVIVVPVDAHPELFGSHVRESGVPARRCDLILVRVSQRSFKIEYIEVKARSRAKLPKALADDIVDQLVSTESLLNRKIFGDDTPREDAPLQWARWAGLLHYYADRSAVNGFISSDKIADIHKYIDRIEEQQEKPEASMRGFVVCVGGEVGFPKKVRDVPITVLTAAELGRIGFTTMLEAKQRANKSEEARSTLNSESQGELADIEDLIQSRKNSTPSKPTKPVQLSVAGAVSDLPGGIQQEVLEKNIDEIHAESRSIDTKLPGTSKYPEMVNVILGQDANKREVSWEVSTQGSPHAFILGIPGQGKSVTTRRILRDFSDQGLPSLVIDYHGDMAQDAEPGTLIINAANGLPFSPFEIKGTGANASNEAAWEISEILGVVFGLGEMQRTSVYEALQQAYSLNQIDGVLERLPTIEEFTEQIELVEISNKVKNIKARLRPMLDFGLFPGDFDAHFNLLSSQGVIIDLSGIGLSEVQLAASSFMLRKIYHDMFSWPQDKRMRLAIVLDEAHRMAKDVTLPKLMKEGRKYGISVVVASQGVEDFNSQVLENAGVKIAFRTNFPASKKVASRLRGKGSQDLSENLEQLSVGEAYVSTPDHAQARKVYMYE
jgi:hypothetical protein